MHVISHKNKSVNVHQFAMIPRADIPRSKFVRQFAHKTTFDENYLVPCYVDEVLPGDTFSLRMTAFARLATPIYPIMDNAYLDTFFFFVPNRLVWDHWVNFQGEQRSPGDSVAFTIPVCSFAAAAGYAPFSLQDYMGLPTNSRFATGTWSHNNLPMRAYNLIWNEWFRDENLQNWAGPVPDRGDGPDTPANYVLLKRGKRHDYFTSGLPWAQKGGVPVTIPIGTSAPVKAGPVNSQWSGVQSYGISLNIASTGAFPTAGNATGITGSGSLARTTTTASTTSDWLYPNNLYADLSTATGATINALRTSFQIQKLLERDARGGTRYTEALTARFGVTNPDFRLQRPEYLGGGSTQINFAPIAQTAQTGLTGGTTPLGTLGAHAAALAQGHGFTQSFTEHGYVIGLMNVRADISYQQGLRKMWSRSTRYDFYEPVFQALGEQAILNQELFIQGVSGTLATQDQGVYAYNERWAEYRYLPSMITGAFRSDYATPLDAWHLSEKFLALPALNATFIQANAPIPRAIAAPLTGQHFLCDMFFNVNTTRAMPLYSVPGFIDHF